MRQLGILLTVMAGLIVSPIVIPIVFALHAREMRRMRAVAGATQCEACGAILGEASIQLADRICAERVSVLFREHPGLRIRMAPRRLWAKCAACGTEYNYDMKRQSFFT